MGFVLPEFFASIEDLIAVLERPKRLVNRSWTLPEKRGQRGFKLKSALFADSATLAGVTLEIRCNSEGFELPSAVVLMAEIYRKPHAIARIDINGPPHPNAKAVCGDLQNKNAGSTHFHDTRLHSRVPFQELFDGTHGNLPVARPIDDMPSEFSKAMEKCGKLLHIEDLGEVEEPQWQPKQLPF